MLAYTLYGFRPLIEFVSIVVVFSLYVNIAVSKKGTLRSVHLHNCLVFSFLEATEVLLTQAFKNQNI